MTAENPARNLRASVSVDTWNDWQWQMAHAETCVSGMLLPRLQSGAMTATGIADVVTRYPLRVTPYYLALADLADADDPILKQCLPDVQELGDRMSCSEDPYSEVESSPLPGIVQRYPDRVLVTAQSCCAVYCRHCTRKNTLQRLAPALSSCDVERIVEFISSRVEIREVILSGGDPLLCETDWLDDLLVRMEAIPHVEVLRIHTRAPVVLPMRFDNSLCEMLARHRPIWVNTQFNHPRELSEEAESACEMLTCRGIPVSNQAVLLKGINDTVSTMVELCSRLQRASVRPYYVFECDSVSGADHFRTPPGVARRLADGVKARLGGLATPLFVRDQPGEIGKQPV